MKYQNTNRRFGFTLIELLVVIAIISLLVSILLPSLRKAKDLAQSVVCQTNLRSIAYLTYQYLGDNRNYFPDMLDLKTIEDKGLYEPGQLPEEAWRLQTWQYKLMEQYNNGEGMIFDCPTHGNNYMKSLAPSDYGINRAYQWGENLKNNFDCPKQWGNPFLRRPEEILYIADTRCSGLFMKIFRQINLEFMFYRCHKNETAANILCLDLHVEGNQEPYPYLNGEDGKPGYEDYIYPNESK